MPSDMNTCLTSRSSAMPLDMNTPYKQVSESLPLISCTSHESQLDQIQDGTTARDMGRNRSVAWPGTGACEAISEAGFHHNSSSKVPQQV